MRKMTHTKTGVNLRIDGIAADGNLIYGENTRKSYEKSLNAVITCVQALLLL